ncbi:MAG: hypothetical protein WA864_15560 [Acetobacteraceae bacterium]|jgi:hypothetical protein
MTDLQWFAFVFLPPGVTAFGPLGAAAGVGLINLADSWTSPPPPRSGRSSGAAVAEVGITGVGTVGVSSAVIKRGETVGNSVATTAADQTR